MAPSATTSTALAATSPPPPTHFTQPPRILIIGAGSRGTAYAQAALDCSNALITTVIETIASKRRRFAARFIHHSNGSNNNPSSSEGSEFAGLDDWISSERTRRTQSPETPGVNAVLICVLDEMHEEVACQLAELGGLHILVEKPLSTSLQSCVKMYDVLKRQEQERVFGICHVLRYSPHNVMLRDMVVNGEVGEVLSLEHTEPVGWWHFSHSYVRGNWRKEKTTAPSLLTKSCHDIDFILWLLCSPLQENAKPHLPSYLTSTGSRTFFRKERKPIAAGEATNCLACPFEAECEYSAKKIYVERHLDNGNTGWPVKIVHSDIEDVYKTQGVDKAREMLLKNLSEDYTSETPTAEVEARPWFGRCVWESDNDVCDDQCVTMTWEDDPVDGQDGKPELTGRGAKTAQFHMVAFTEKICERRGRIYGTKGEIEYDSKTIKVHNFATGKTVVHSPLQMGGGHGGGDIGLIRQFLFAVDAVESRTMAVSEAQRRFLGCDLDEAFRSHAAVFAAEEARTQRKVVDWEHWWSESVEPQLRGR
ncbi:streptomycin biosynthesis protein StrI [Sporormia fimetaria CBS 119925]|uniref:Streptomycin biosynthesis protein StrI n=1 Tax=Sporormia fimetaria CBS 119925 TaxID=1340428 RepID=A0A6A6V9S6_9PLEO|nr:streptomycin biosynthesis protein StrI [Sporormia fimetaria CBS 119925]